ncbi:Ig-like domain repeat protein [Paenibacillus sp.]|uniref:Ig-like domain repeat protein n=1 Tax=Paenibacillus sp. TaxID=58172 RepID=UPI0028121283|nr:Ig-like domain repeat protein [Paenibacillus sp.]
MRRAKQWAITLLVFTLVFGMFGGTALGASTRFALVTDVTGTVKVTKAGGTKEIRVFDGMGLNEGDKLKVEKGGSVTLKVADRDDEVVLGDTWNGTLSKLKDKAGGSDTAVKTWAGSMYSKVEKITGSSSTYKVETPTAVMGVRGTHFTVSIDPITGLPTMFVSAGKVEAASPGQEDSTLLLPAQQITIYPDAPPEAGVSYVDPSEIVKQADKSVIEALLKNKTLIDEENEEILNDLSETGDASQEGTLRLEEQEALDRYRSNVENALFNILKTAVDTGTIDEEETQDIIEAANQGISDQDRQYDLNRDVPPIDRTAGVDPSAERQREQQRQRAEERKQQQVQQKEEKKSEVTNNNASLIQQIQQAAQQQQQANQQAQEQKKQEATDRLLQQLSQQQRDALQQRVEQKEQEKQQQETGKAPTTPTQPTQQPDSSSDDRTATTTTVELSKSELVVGEAITITASVKNNITGNAVPDGATVTFRKGATSIGTATTSGGKAVLSLTAAQSLTTFPMGTHAVNAIYPGMGSLESSTSFSQSLKVKSATTMTVEGPTSSAIGATFTLGVTVAATSPGTGTPVGTVELYDSSLKIGEKTLVSGATSFELKPNATAPTTKTYRAVYKPSDTALYVGNEKTFTHDIVSPTPASPELTLAKTDTTNGFDIAVKLDNFTGAKKLYGMQLHFVSGRTVSPALPTNSTYYTADKFPEQTAEVLRYVDGVNESGQELREQIYSLTLYGSGTAVAFDEDETMATLKFTKPSGIGDPELFQYVYAQFVFEDGTSYVPAATYSWTY